MMRTNRTFTDKLEEKKIQYLNKEIERSIAFVSAKIQQSQHDNKDTKALDRSISVFKYWIS